MVNRNLGDYVQHCVCSSRCTCKKKKKRNELKKKKTFLPVSNQVIKLWNFEISEAYRFLSKYINIIDWRLFINAHWPFRKDGRVFCMQVIEKLLILNMWYINMISIRLLKVFFFFFFFYKMNTQLCIWPFTKHLWLFPQLNLDFEYIVRIGPIALLVKLFSF